LGRVGFRRCRTPTSTAHCRGKFRPAAFGFRPIVQHPSQRCLASEPPVHVHRRPPSATLVQLSVARKAAHPPLIGRPLVCLFLGRIYVFRMKSVFFWSGLRSPTIILQVKREKIFSGYAAALVSVRPLGVPGPRRS